LEEEFEIIFKDTALT